MNKKLVITAVIIVVIAAIVVFFVFRREPSPAPGEEKPQAEELPPFDPLDLSEPAAMLTVGEIVVRGIGTFQSQDPFFRNLRSLEGYVTADFWEKLQDKIAAGIDEKIPPFEQRATILDRKVSDQTALTATALYTVEVWRSDTSATVRQTVTAGLVKSVGNWYVEDTTQIK